MAAPLGKLPEWSLVRCQLVAQPIELVVLPGKFLPKGAIGVDGHPAIDGNVAKSLRAIPQQKGLDVTGSLPKQCHPRSVWPVVTLELRLSPGTYLEFPEVNVLTHEPSSVSPNATSCVDSREGEERRDDWC